MNKEIEKLKRTIINRNPLKVKNLTHTIVEQLGDSANTKKIIDEMMHARGTILDMAIRLETIFNEIILLFNRPRLIESSFKVKVQFLKRIIRDIDKEANHFSDDRQFHRLNDMVLIRNLFAHVPVKKRQNNLEFDIKDPYKMYFSKRYDLKDVTQAAIEFNDLYNYVQKEINLFLHVLRSKFDGSPV